MSSITMIKAHSITLEEFEKMTVESRVQSNVKDSDIEILEEHQKNDKLCEVIIIDESDSNDSISENVQENFKIEILDHYKNIQENIIGICNTKEAIEKVYDKANIQKDVAGNLFFLWNNDFKSKYWLLCQLFRLDILDKGIGENYFFLFD